MVIKPNVVQAIGTRYLDERGDVKPPAAAIKSFNSEKGPCKPGSRERRCTDGCFQKSLGVEKSGSLCVQLEDASKLVEGTRQDPA